MPVPTLDGNMTDFYPAYFGAISYAPIESDNAPLQPTLSPRVMASMPASHQWPTILWIGGFMVFALIMMHWADR